jgi:hypothetical protein
MKFGLCGNFGDRYMFLWAKFYWVANVLYEFVL